MSPAAAQIIPRSRPPDEVADAVRLFCRPESNYISAQVIVAGGDLIV